MNNTKLKVQKCGSRWRVIIDSRESTRPYRVPTPYENLKASLGISSEQSEKSKREDGLMGLEKPTFKSDKEQALVSEFDSLWTNGATNGELNWCNEEHTIAYFWTTKEKLYAGFVSQAMSYLLQESYVLAKGMKGGLLPIAEDMAKDKFNSLENMPDFKDYKAPKIDIINLEHTFACGSVSAERPDDNGKGTFTNVSISAGDKAAANVKKWSQGTVPELS